MDLGLLYKGMGRLVRRPHFFAAVVITAYLCVAGALLLHHEPWQDEAQPWLVAQVDLTTFFQQIHYESTPALWYLVLWVLAHLGLPYPAASVLHFFLAVAIVAIFVLKAPFPKLTKLCFAFSYYMAYEYAVIARPYTIALLFLFLITAGYPQRFRRPFVYALLVAGLYNTNALGVFCAATCTAIYVYELLRQGKGTGTQYAAFGCMCVAGALAVWQMIPAADFLMHDALHAFYPWAVVVALRQAFFPFPYVATPLDIFLGVALGIIAVCILALVRRIIPLLFVLLPCMGIAYILTFKHAGGLRHYGFILMLFLCALWLGSFYTSAAFGNFRNRTLRRLFETGWLTGAVWLLTFSMGFSTIYLVNVGLAEVRFAFSGGKEMADFMRQQKLQELPIAVYPDAPAISVLAYFSGKEAWYVGRQEYRRFFRFDKRYLDGDSLDNREVIRRFRQEFPPESSALLLMGRPLEVSESYGMRQLYQTQRPVIGYGHEQFYLYQSLYAR